MAHGIPPPVTKLTVQLGYHARAARQIELFFLFFIVSSK